MSGGSIHDHLRELRGRVAGGPLRRRRILGEVRAHLEDAASEEERAGHTRDEAERIAVERFGVPFAERQRRSMTRVAVPAVAAVIAVAGLIVAVQGRGAGSRPQAHGPAIPYSSVPLCGTMTWRQVRFGTMACRPAPAVATIGVPAYPVGKLPRGVTPGPGPGSAS